METLEFALVAFGLVGTVAFPVASFFFVWEGTFTSNPIGARDQSDGNAAHLVWGVAAVYCAVMSVFSILLVAHV